ncbi:MAG: hypothetical protein ACREIC_15575, partial [Limisphaerales bacterium]
AERVERFTAEVQRRLRQAQRCLDNRTNPETKWAFPGYSRQTMNTMPILTGQDQISRFRLGGSTSLAGSLGPRPAEWLPVPAPRQPGLEGAVRVAKARQNLWSGSPVAPLIERMMAGLLGLAATAGIGYGFCCLLDLVQHWAIFGAGIDRFLQ